MKDRQWGGLNEPLEATSCQQEPAHQTQESVKSTDVAGKASKSLWTAEGFSCCCCQVLSSGST